MHFNDRKAFHAGDLSAVAGLPASSLQGCRARARVVVDPQSLASEVKKGKDDLSKAAAVLLAVSANKGDAAKSRETARKIVESSSDVEARIVAATAVLKASLGSSDAEDVDAVDAAVSALGEIAETHDISAGALEAVALVAQAACVRRDLDGAVAAAEGAKTWSHDSPAAQLVSAWVDVCRGGEEQYRSAYYTFQEYADTAGEPDGVARMQTAQAACEIQMGNYEEADATLKAVLNKKAEYGDALANTAVLAALRGQREAAQDAYTRLKAADTAHPLVQKITHAESEFDRLAQKYVAA